ncbi:uncharacterized protein LOC132803253 [Ziziphus jujuba]|uniref:Uncharacterized protein LOC132803253 n=1 Tax=Ziziphus jujuba TaxID=326968 RepID=A0ABM4A508_ZIZJJ|nr:uncharacterized protein LOC132803253 [Ziziphus jujuba]
MSFLNSLLDNDVNCISQLRMDRRTFDTLCQLLCEDGYVKSDGIVTLEEQNCLGALDGTYIKVNIPENDKPRYRTRKVPSWEGSASDSLVLRDALSRPNGLRVQTVDAGYTNSEGFLAPYRETRYHLSEWRDSCAPINHEEYFNMKHASARNVIERCFGVLKKWWAILRSPSFYPIATQIKIITACCLIHNRIRREMIIDPGEVEFDRSDDVDVNIEDDFIGSISSSDQWTHWRDDLAKQMFDEWRCRRGH